MIITRVTAFAGYKDMDPNLIPQFKESEREAAARKLLEEEGTRFRYSELHIQNGTLLGRQLE
jgi:hypothetical protein